MSLVSELKRRNVFKVTAAYIIVAWLLLQVSDTLVPALRLPEWFHSGVAFLLIMGLPIAIVFAWAFELTPEGLRKEKEVDRSQSVAHKTGKKLDYAIIAVLAIAVVSLAGKLWFAEDDAATVITSTERKSIAVLPFDNRSADEEDAEFFAAGVHDELLTLLSRLGDLKVISRTSVERLDQDLSLPEIGALLGVVTVLEGQVQRAGDRLRINVQLINAAEGNHLWATTYDRELTASNVFDVQSDIARTIANELQVTLSPKDNALLRAVPTNSMEALQRYMLGRQLVERGTFESFEKAADYLSEATELDPNYAEAWVAIAYANSRMFQTGLIGLQDYIAAAAPSIDRALRINNALPEAHAELAALQWQSGDTIAAEASFKTALELGSENSQSLYSYGNYLRKTARPLEAVPVLKRALERNPLSVTTLFDLGKAEMYSGQPEQFIVRAQKILEIAPSSVHGYVANLQAYDWMGRFDLMWPWYIKSIASDPEDFEIWCHLGLYASYLGADDLIDPYLDRAVELGPREPAVLRCLVSVLRYRGQFDAAVDIARSALEEGLDDRWQSNEIFLRLVRDDALRSGNFDGAIFWYLDRHPELFLETPEIKTDNVNAAADLALLLQRAGEPNAASAIINAGLTWIQQTQPKGVHGYLINIADVELLALDGQTQAALDTLQQAVDSGWRSHWRSSFGNENLASLRSEPGFQQMTAQLEKDMAAQLEAIRALPNMGEFDLRPGVLTPVLPR
jgi:TolB-like protein/tetratricopeptide (TPR) repeat protein